jgi:hypothetical protein
MTEQEFEDRILAALKEIDTARAAQPPADAWRGVLEHFARTLSRHPAIGAAVDDVPDLPGGLKLLTWPKLRRDERAPMLNFAGNGGSLVLLGEGRRVFRSPEDLEAYLTKDFLLQSSFPSTLAAYEETCALPVRGFLRKGQPNGVNLADVPVRLLPAEQRKLVETPPGEDITVMALEDRIPLTSLFVSGETYVSLVAGGHGMWVMFPSRAEDSRLRIAGVVMREHELVDGLPALRSA